MSTRVKNNLLLFSILIISACSHAPVTPKASVPHEITDKEIFSAEGLEMLSNDDFKVPAQVPFNPKLDSYISNMPIDKETLDHNIEKIPENVDSDELGNLVKLCYQKDFSNALDKFNKIYRKYQKNPSYFNQVGTCYYLKNDRRMSLVFYNRARDLDSKYAPAINNVGVLLLKDGKTQKALEAFKKARELKPFSKTPSYNLGHLYLKFGLVNESMEIFKSLRSEHPDDVEVINGLAHAYLLKGDLEGALGLWEILDEKFIKEPRFGLSYSLALKINKQDENSKTVYLSLDRSKLAGLENYYNNVGKYIGEKK